MSETELDAFSVATLRTAIRAKLHAGADRQTISQLIRKYVPSSLGTLRVSDGVYRLPVEMIPLSQRMAFLNALDELPDQLRAEGEGIRLNFGTV